MIKSVTIPAFKKTCVLEARNSPVRIPALILIPSQVFSKVL